MKYKTINFSEFTHSVHKTNLPETKISGEFLSELLDCYIQRCEHWDFRGEKSDDIVRDFYNKLDCRLTVTYEDLMEDHKNRHYYRYKNEQ
jgi:hypothetical protein